MEETLGWVVAGLGRRHAKCASERASERWPMRLTRAMWQNVVSLYPQSSGGASGALPQRLSPLTPGVVGPDAWRFNAR